MGKRVASMLILALSLALGGCYTHNFPLAHEQFIAAESPRTDPAVPTARVFVDPYGSFFPSDWRPDQAHLGLFERWNEHSLLAEAAHWPGFAPRLQAEQARQLGALSAFIAGKQRLFIFIHGFNASQGRTDLPYHRLAERIAFQPGDGLILFHWDGFDAHVPGAQLLFWSDAAPNGEMAGTQALRRILALTSPDQQIYLISHSRGASVILSAVSDPPYSARFRQQTEALPFAAAAHLLDPPALPEGPRNLHAIMLAPAIGRIDFLRPECAGPASSHRRNACDQVRAFPRLASLDYTVNPCDAVLDKFIGLARRFNPTDFGLDPAIGTAISSEIAGVRMHGWPLAAPHAHEFSLYAADPELTGMLADAGVQSRLWPDPPQPQTCRRLRHMAVR